MIIESANKISKWIFRLLGTVLVYMGVFMLLSPLTTLVGVDPLLGKFDNGALRTVSSFIDRYKNIFNCNWYCFNNCFSRFSNAC